MLVKQELIRDNIANFAKVHEHTHCLICICLFPARKCLDITISFFSRITFCDAHGFLHKTCVIVVLWCRLQILETLTMTVTISG